MKWNQSNLKVEYLEKFSYLSNEFLSPQDNTEQIKFDILI